jgi:hypothetical protein
MTTHPHVKANHGPSKAGRRWSISLDYDGVLGKEDGYTNPMVEWDYSLITEALDKGYAVAIVTCNLPRYIASELRKAGFDALADEKMLFESWDGGPNGTDVLVTNRKLHTDMHVDDRVFEHHYGTPTSAVWTEFAVRQERWLVKHAGV